MEQSRINDLEIYNAAFNISNKVWAIVIKWNSFEKNTLGSQLVRAIDSVGANIAEGYGKGSKLDNARFVKIAKGSLFETQYWLKQANVRGLINEHTFQALILEIDNLLPRISSYIKYLNNT